MNMGTSLRSPCCPRGDETKLSVAEANRMAARRGVTVKALRVF